jgi:hypothetical protein
MFLFGGNRRIKLKVTFGHNMLKKKNFGHNNNKVEGSS